MLWVHVPYSKHKNEITSIENVIVKENNYSNVKYFDRYNSDKSYYIIRATKGKKQQYAVFDEKYKQEPSEVSVGYENEIFVYCLMYQGKDSLVYAFYGIDNGEFVKAYRIDNG